MIIKLIIKIVFCFKFSESFMDQLLVAFLQRKKVGQIELEDQKKLAKEKCQQDLNRVLTYEKLKEKSGLPKPKVYPKGK